MVGMVVYKTPRKIFRNDRMILRIRIPPADLLERIEDCMYAAKHTKDASVQTFLIETIRIYPNFVKEAYLRKRFILHRAIKHNNLYAIHALLNSLGWNEACINMPDKHGNTPILLALANKHTEVVNKLVAYGANITEFSIMKKILQLQWSTMS
jgi:hypothetical protein